MTLHFRFPPRELRIEAPVAGTNFVGIEVPNKVPSLVTLRSVYESEAYQNTLKKAKTPRGSIGARCSRSSIRG
jgi:DNA segregation ATPase FtsK/SpoIIIE-like protein